MTQKLGHAKETETICMEPLDLRERDRLGKLVSYACEASRQINSKYENQFTICHKEHVDTIIIPIRMMSG